MRLHFHHTAVAITGSVYLRTISTKQEVGEVKFGANVAASTPEHMKNNCNAGPIDAICMKQKDDMKKTVTCIVSSLWWNVMQST